MFHLVTVVHIMSEKQLRVLASMPAGILPPKNEVVNFTDFFYAY